MPFAPVVPRAIRQESFRMRSMMHAGTVSFFLAALLGTSPTTGESQKTPSTSSLPRALASFAAADVDHDGKISSEEARAIPVSAAVFAAEDENGDGSWSRDEFLLFYRRQLIAGGQPAGADLEAEIARVQALKRVRIVEQTNRLTAETSARCVNADSVSERFESALADLEKKCSARKATREDFQRLRNLVILNGRAADKPESEGRSPASQAAMLEAVDKVEKTAALGQSTKESIQSLREIASGPARARTPSSEPPRNTPQVGAVPLPAKPSPVIAPTGPADARQRAQQKIEPKTDRPLPPSPTPAPAPIRTPADKDKSERARP
jgi:hypothetical protein